MKWAVFAYNDGSIPACAGEPPVAIISSILRRVYPRVCGGTLLTWREFHYY